MHLTIWKSTEQVFVLDRPFTAFGMVRDEHGDVTIIVLDGLNGPQDQSVVESKFWD